MSDDERVGIGRPEIIRIIESDERFHNYILSWRNGYMGFETLTGIVIKTLVNDRINREFADIAQSIVDEAGDANL